MKHLLFIFICILVIFIATPFALLGKLPIISSLIGATPKDLGIRITKNDSIGSQTKIGTEVIAITKDIQKDDFTLEGTKVAEFTMDSKEITALSNNRAWKYYPLKDVQIKIHDDGTIESSAILVISKAMPYALGLGYSQTEIKSAMEKYSIPPFEVPIYILGKGSVANDSVTVNAQTVKIGAVPVPHDIVAQANTGTEKVLNDLIKKHTNSFHAESVSFSADKMHFKGRVAEKQYVYTE